MVNYACAFSQWELGKYFEWTIMAIIQSNCNVWYYFKSQIAAHIVFVSRVGIFLLHCLWVFFFKLLIMGLDAI